MRRQSRILYRGLWQAGVMKSDERDLGNLVDISSGTWMAGGRNDSIPRGLWNTPYGGSPTRALRRVRCQPSNSRYSFSPPRPGMPGLLMNGLSDRGTFLSRDICPPRPDGSALFHPCRNSSVHTR